MFEYIEGFSKGEKWGDPFKMNGFTILLLEKIRHIYRLKYDKDASFVIHCGFETSGHTPNSWHYKGYAVDFHIKSKLSFWNQYYAVLTILNDLQVAHLVGFGIYPDWNSPGFHLDTRGKIARWGFVDGEQVPLTVAVKHAKAKEIV